MKIHIGSKRWDVWVSIGELTHLSYPQLNHYRIHNSLQSPDRETGCSGSEQQKKSVYRYGYGATISLSPTMWIQPCAQILAATDKNLQSHQFTHTESVNFSYGFLLNLGTIAFANRQIVLTLSTQLINSYKYSQIVLSTMLLRTPIQLDWLYPFALPCSTHLHFMVCIQLLLLV